MRYRDAQYMGEPTKDEVRAFVPRASRPRIVCSEMPSGFMVEGSRSMNRYTRLQQPGSWVEFELRAKNSVFGYSIKQVSPYFSDVSRKSFESYDKVSIAIRSMFVSFFTFKAIQSYLPASSGNNILQGQPAPPFKNLSYFPLGLILLLRFSLVLYVFEPQIPGVRGHDQICRPLDCQGASQEQQLTQGQLYLLMQQRPHESFVAVQKKRPSPIHLLTQRAFYWVFHSNSVS